MLRRLALIVSPYSAPPSSPSVKRYQFTVELSLGLIIPLVQVPLHFLFQGHQVNEVKDFGCIAPIYPSVPSILVVLCYPVLIDTIGMAYAGESNVLRGSNLSFSVCYVSHLQEERHN